MINTSVNNKRIAKNTLLLYFRTLLIMAITLYTSRVILNALGVEDYGIYNVVGGVVAMFSLISGSLSNAISRFITFELGRGDTKKLSTIFSTSVNIQIGISLLVIILGILIGGWFLNSRMNIPAERMVAANWVLCCSLLMFCINLISLPYNACIIAHERMAAFAYVSILDASLRLRSNDSRDRYFLYDVSLDYRYGADNLDYRDEAIGLRSLSGHEFSLNSVFGPVFSSASRLTIGLGLDMEYYSSAFGTSSGKVTVRPAYSIDKGRWNLDLGVKFSAMFRGGENGLLPAQNVRKGQYVYPDIEVGYEIVRDYLEVYADIGGGEKTGRYSDLIEKSHYIRPFYTLQSNSPLLDNTVERVSVSLGFRGNISSRFIYDLKTGYRNFANAPLYAVVAGSEDLRDGFFTTLGYTGFQMFYASLDYGWESADFSLDGNFTYRSTDVAGKVSAPDVLNSIMAYFSPAAFSGDIRAMYNWHGRIYAGADCDFSLARESALCSTAGYADLGMYVEIRAARLFSFWLRGGNLLNMTVQHTPMYAESGINFTAGICLNL